MSTNVKQVYLTNEELKEVEDPRVAAALMLKELRTQTRILEQMDWKVWETMKKVVGKEPEQKRE